MIKIVGILLVMMVLFMSIGMACANESCGDALIESPPVWAEGSE